MFSHLTLYHIYSFFLGGGLLLLHAYSYTVKLIGWSQVMFMFFKFIAWLDGSMHLMNYYPQTQSNYPVS